jgi:NADPH:quinone reductase-like Zn-dependent oxidoreductase
MTERLDAFLAEHKIKPVIDRVFEWTEAIEATDYLVKAGHFGKIVIKIE